METNKMVNNQETEKKAKTINASTMLFGALAIGATCFGLGCKYYKYSLARGLDLCFEQDPELYERIVDALTKATKERLMANK